jgi:hypothetical protein
MSLLRETANVGCETSAALQKVEADPYPDKAGKSPIDGAVNVNIIYPLVI